MKQTISILLLMAMVFTLFTGCGGAAVSASAPEESQAAEKPTLEPAVEEHAEGSVAEEPSSSQEEPEERPVPEDAVSLPLDETETLTYWHDVGGDMVNYLEQGDYNNQPAMRYAEELTNVHIDNIITTAQTMNTDFQLMVASGDYADMIFNGATLYSGGAAAAVEEELIIDIAPYAEQGYIPNYEAAYNISKAQAGDVRTDDGYITTFLTIYKNGPDPANGLWIRKDWLDTLGKDVPETYDELHEVLTLFQSEFGAAEPYYTYIFGDSHLTEGYGVGTELLESDSYLTHTFLQKDGQVTFSALEPEWLEAVTMMNQWYEEGLFGKDLANHTMNITDAAFGTSVCTGGTGVFRCGTRMIDMVSGNGVDYDPDYELVAMADVTVNRGDALHYNWYTKGYATNGICISTQCENVPLALAWCDFWYSPEGSIIAEYGEEGVSYELVDGKPQWTSLITDNPDGLTLNTAITMYQMQVGWLREITTDTTGWDQKTKDALEVWSDKWDGAYSIPDTISLTTEEATAFAASFNQISTYYTEMIARFICGEEPLENYDSFCQSLLDMGIEDCINIEQAALERYQNR